MKTREQVRASIAKKMEPTRTCVKETKAPTLHNRLLQELVDADAMLKRVGFYREVELRTRDFREEEWSYYRGRLPLPDAWKFVELDEANVFYCYEVEVHHRLDEDKLNRYEWLANLLDEEGGWCCHVVIVDRQGKKSVIEGADLLMAGIIRAIERKKRGGDLISYWEALRLYRQEAQS